MKRLALLIVLLSALLAVPFLPKDEPAVLPVAQQAMVNEIDPLTTLTNQQRLNVGLPALIEDEALEKSAKLKCDDMELKNYWAHSDIGTLEDVWEFHPHRLYLGENLAKEFNTDSLVMTGWMNSEKHRDNILDTDFHKVGFARCDGAQRSLIVQHFSN